MIVLLLMRTLQAVSRLQSSWFKGNHTHKLADRRCFAPKVCFTYHSRISILYALGIIPYLFVGSGVNGK